ncbi:MAG: DUF2062 domain-containing protein [Thermodesulfobacteriota bacterium]|nr:DUF2062 domain-containing protein [Thermodesulfobacteriota bacterium]
MNFIREIKYYYLKFLRLRGAPRDLALGMALGVFTGMMPIIPLQTALAITLAVFLKASKITAAIGTWVSNPFNWYFLYYYNYITGSFILRLPEQKKVFSSIMTAIQSGEESMIIAGKIIGAGSAFISSFLVGGLVMGVVCATPAYFIFLRLFIFIRGWRQSRREHTQWRMPDH